jgi:hypothetical protein
MTNNLLIPAAADNKLFENIIPYLFDIHPNGNIAILESIMGLNLEIFDNIYIIVLRKHEEKYKLKSILAPHLIMNNLSLKIKIHVIGKPTLNQPATIAKTIRELGIKGGLCVKDPDNSFECQLIPGNFISSYALDDLHHVNPRNKSYLMLDEHKYVTNIIEQKIISRYFCTGAYFFEDASFFLKYFNRLKNYGKLYISHLIYSMLLDGISFRPIEVTNYKDWGTLEEWQEFKNSFKTQLIPVGNFFLNKSFIPKPDQKDLNHKFINHVNRLFDLGNCRIIIVTEHPDSFYVEILKFLKSSNIRFHKLLTETYTRVNPNTDKLSYLN